MAQTKYYILALERLDGEDTMIYLEADGVATGSLFCVVSIGPHGAGIIDNGYRSLSEVRAAWPEAIVPSASTMSSRVRAANFTIDAESSRALATVLQQRWKKVE
jgi:hypothetical protein